MKNNNLIKDVCLIKRNQYLRRNFSHSARASFGFPYFNQFLKFLQKFPVFNILRYHSPYLGSYKSDRMYAIVCCFYVFSPELAGLRTEIIDRMALESQILSSLFQVISYFLL